MSRSGESATRRNRETFGGPFGRIYAAYMERPRLARSISRLVWGSDLRPFYRSMDAIGTLAPGATVVDVPCGGGVAFRAIGRRQDVRFLAGDLSPRMLNLARKRAEELDLGQVELFEADAEALPFAAGDADLFLSYFGLHCLDRPQVALGEAARCLRPGGLLLGAAIVAGPSWRQRILVRPHTGAFGRVGTFEQIEGWLREAGFVELELERASLIAYFRARKPRSR